MFNIDHYAISVQNADESIEFYEKLDFSILKDWHADDDSVRIVHMTNGDFILEIFCYPDSDKIPDFTKELNKDLKVKGAKHLGLCVENLNVAKDYLLQKGIINKEPTICMGRMGRPYFFIKDPDGIFVEIILKR